MNTTKFLSIVLVSALSATDAFSIPAAPGAVAPTPAPKIEKLDLDAAIKEVMADDPTAVSEIYRVVGEAYMRKQKSDRAISLLGTYLSNGGENPSVVMQLANFYNQLGMPAAVVTMYEDLVQKNAGKPQQIAYSMNLLNLYRQNGRWADAIKLLQERVKSEPKNPDPHVQLADIYRNQNDMANAEASLKKAITLQPQPWYYQQLAQIHVQQKKISKAVAVLEEGSKKLPPNDAEFKIAIADIYQNDGKKEKALKVLKNALANAKEDWRKQDLQRRIMIIENPSAVMPPGGPGGPAMMRPPIRPNGPGMDPEMMRRMNSIPPPPTPPMPGQQPAAQPATAQPK